MHVENHPRLGVTIRVNGADLQKYIDTSELPASITSDSTTAYVEAVAGAAFQIHFRGDAAFKPPQTTGRRFRYTVFLDGVSMGSYSCGARGQIRESLSGVVETTNGVSSMRNFIFANIGTTELGTEGDKRTEKQLREQYKSLGEIKVTWSWSYVTNELQKPKDRGGNNDSLPLGAAFGDTAPFKALKGRAVSRRTTFGDPQQIPSAPKKAKTWTTINNGKISGTYIFRYRSREDLQSELIIPRSESPRSKSSGPVDDPTPLEDRDPETLTLEEKKKLIESMKELRQIKERIKRESRDDADIKEQNTRRKRPRANTSRGPEEIDLTGD